MITCIAIDDENHCIGTIEALLTKHFPQIKLEASCSNGLEGLKAITKLNPDIVFLDISMPIMDGLEMLSHISNPGFQLIFTTAYDEYAIKAIKLNALDYLMKPIDQEEFVAAVNKALEKIEDLKSSEKQGSNQNIKDLIASLNIKSKRERIPIPTMEGFQMVEVNDILFVEADGNYSKIHKKDNGLILVSKPLKETSKLLRSFHFVRIHRQTVVNINHIERYVKGNGGYLVLTNGKHLDVSRRRRDAVLKLLK